MHANLASYLMGTPLTPREGGKWVGGGLALMLEYLKNGERYDVEVSMWDLQESTCGLSIGVVRFILQ